MDTSKEYIEMCENAIEIQFEWKVIEGDFFGDGSDEVKIVGMDYIKVKHIDERRVRFFAFSKNQKVSIEEKFDCPKDFSFTIGEGEYEIINIHNAIWLPRQDQLQDMITAYDTIDHNKDEQLFSFYEFCFKEFLSEEYHKRNRMSYEQLWLAFVMKKKYNAIWDGKKWIKEKW